MNVKTVSTIIATLLVAITGTAQNKETNDSITRELQEVVVTARQPATRLVGSTLVTTITGSNLANLGNALDVLAQLPMLKVQDNAVSVIGKNNIEIYIDGRQMRDGFELERILSTNLKKVELIMAPGAAYGSSTGAVLRITTLSNFLQGVSLTDRFQIQKRRKWSVMDNLSMSYNIGRFEYFMDGVINRNDMIIKGTTTNTLLYDGKKTIVGSSQNNNYPTTTGMVRGGFNFAKDGQSFGAYYRYNPERGDFSNSGTEWLDNNLPLVRDIDRQIRAHSHLASVYYENSFADKYLLHFDGDFKSSVADNSVATTYPDGDAEDVNSFSHRKSSLWAGKLYLEFPLFSGNATVGTQDSYTHTTLDYRMLNSNVGQYLPSSFTDAKQTSAAIFASWSRLLGKLSLSAGARYEYVDYDFKVDGVRDENVSRRDHLLTPNISLGYYFNDNAQVSLNYKMATVKPPYSQLTGSLSYVGLHEIEGGNPSLHDEKMHNIQVFGMWNGFMLQTDFTRAIDTYAHVKQLYPADNLQLLLHPVNINVSALSTYLIWSKPVKRWTPNITLGMYRQWLTIDNTRYNRPIFSYYFNNTLSLPRGWTLTANINGGTKGDMHTNRFGGSAFAMDMSVGKTLLDKALTIKLSATDIFNTLNNDWTMNTYGIYVDKRQSYDHRGISLDVTYHFHPRKSKYKGSSAAEAEMNRL